MDNKQEYILCAAILRKEEKEKTCLRNNDIHKIEIGYRHCDIFQRFPNEMQTGSSAQGFYTSKGRFVNREEAMNIALNCGQVDKDKVYSDKLYSEDLY